VSFASKLDDFVEDATEFIEDIGRVDILKRKLIKIAAVYDRGFGASSSANQKANDIIQELESFNEMKFAARGITGNETSPLLGSWSMIWCTAFDVLVLNASPLTSVGAIYQVFQPPKITNIIDFAPRGQSLLPIIPPSLLRAKVSTRGSPRKNHPNRVGLVFESVQLDPIEFLGNKVGGSLPPLGFDLPKLPGQDEESRSGYFDVTFLDEELLVIRQNDPGGMFVLIKVDDAAP